jgi:hypothetical protein
MTTDEINDMAERLRNRIKDQRLKMERLGPNSQYGQHDAGRLAGLRDAYSIVTGWPAP